jgi:hypothetical protein
MAFLGPQPLWHHVFPKAAAIVKKQFRKAAKKLYKNQSFYKRLSEIFYGSEIGFRIISIL